MGGEGVVRAVAAAGLLAAGVLIIIVGAYLEGRRSSAPKIEASADQAVAGALAAEGAQESAARIEIYHQQSAAALEALAALQGAAVQSEDAHAPLDPGRAARLAAHDRVLCATVDFDGCAGAAGGDAGDGP